MSDCEKVIILSSVREIDDLTAESLTRAVYASAAVGSQWFVSLCVVRYRMEHGHGFNLIPARVELFNITAPDGEQVSEQHNLFTEWVLEHPELCAHIIDDIWFQLKVRQQQKYPRYFRERAQAVLFK